MTKQSRGSRANLRPSASVRTIPLSEATALRAFSPNRQGRRLLFLAKTCPPLHKHRKLLRSHTQRYRALRMEQSVHQDQLRTQQAVVDRPQNILLASQKLPLLLSCSYLRPPEKRITASLLSQVVCSRLKRFSSPTMITFRQNHHSRSHHIAHQRKSRANPLSRSHKQHHKRILGLSRARANLQDISRLGRDHQLLSSCPRTLIGQAHISIRLQQASIPTLITTIF